jgi:hypothetical protein
MVAIKKKLLKIKFMKLIISKYLKKEALLKEKLKLFIQKEVDYDENRN